MRARHRVPSVPSPPRSSPPTSRNTGKPHHPCQTAHSNPHPADDHRRSGPRNRWRHDEHGPEDARAVACGPRRRPPRSDPRARRAGEQPQGRQHRDPEASADGVHRRLRLGQELAGVPYDRRGVAAADQRDLQRVRAGLHADAGTARGRRPRRADHGDHRRPAADGGRPPFHGRYRHRCQRHAAHPLQPARKAAHRPAQRLCLQRPVGPGKRCDHRRARRQEDGESDLLPHRWHVCGARAGARSPTSI